jgi:ATP-binding cassette subfamily B (MDR/TAP) protein 1
MSGPPPPPKPGVLGLPPVPFRKLYAYASGFDIFLTIVGCVSGFTAGVVLPLFSIVFGNGLDSFNNPMASMDSIVDSISTLAYFFFYIAIVAGGLTFLQVLCMGLATSNMIDRMRTAYAENLLRLDFAWYDTHRTSEAVARLAESTISISSGLTKVATVLNYTATIIAGLAIGFRTSWKLTLVIFACAPLFAIALGFVIAIAINGEKKGRVAYSRAGGAANEVLSLIRAVGAWHWASGRGHGIYLLRHVWHCALLWRHVRDRVASRRPVVRVRHGP